MKNRVSDGIVNQYQCLYGVGQEMGEERVPIAGPDASEIKFFFWNGIKRSNSLFRDGMPSEHILKRLVFSDDPFFCAKLIDEHTVANLRDKNIVNGLVVTNLWLAI